MIIFKIIFTYEEWKQAMKSSAFVSQMTNKLGATAPSIDKIVCI